MTQPYDYWHVQGASALTLPFQSGEWDSPATSPAQYAWGMLTARPFFVGDSGVKVNRIGLRLFGAAYTGLCRVGIYACPPPSTHNMFPSTLVADLGDLNLFGSVDRFITAGSPIELDPGLYYVATRFYAPGASFPVFGTVHGEARVGGPGFPLGYSPVTGIGYIGFSTYNPSGPLPATFPAICPRRYGVIANNINPPTAIYMEQRDPYTATVFQAQWLYNAGFVGPPIATTDTATQVTVTYGPGATVAQVVTAFSDAANIETNRVFNVGQTTVMPAFSISLQQLQPGGPLQSSNAAVGGYFPATAIEVVL